MLISVRPKRQIAGENEHAQIQKMGTLRERGIETQKSANTSRQQEDCKNSSHIAHVLPSMMPFSFCLARCGKNHHHLRKNARNAENAARPKTNHPF